MLISVKRISLHGKVVAPDLPRRTGVLVLELGRRRAGLEPKLVKLDVRLGLALGHFAAVEPFEIDALPVLEFTEFAQREQVLYWG